MAHQSFAKQIRVLEEYKDPSDIQHKDGSLQDEHLYDHPGCNHMADVTQNHKEMKE